VDPKFRSSFIPKKPLSTKTEGGKIKRRSSFNLMSFIATAIFVVAILASGGSFAYKYYLEDQINQKGILLTEARSLLDLGEIENFKLLDERLSAAWALLRKHKITSQFFEMLETNTLHNIQFDRYEFTENLEIVLKGKAATFNALALQADVFERQNLIEETDYNDFIIGKDELIQFTMTTRLSLQEIKYLMQ